MGQSVKPDRVAAKKPISVHTQIEVNALSSVVTALGNFAVGNFAVGNFAIGKYAVGNFAVRKFRREEIYR